MRRTLRGVRTRVERMAADMGRPSEPSRGDQIMAILLEGRRLAREHPVPRLTMDEMRAEGRELWAERRHRS